MTRIIRQILAVFLILPCCLSLNFLVYCPLIARSHINYMTKLADALVEAGHDVTVLAPIVDSHWLPTFKTKGKVITVPQCKEAAEYENHGRDAIFSTIWRESDASMKNVMMLFEVWRQQCNATLLEPELFLKLSMLKFDAGVTEPMDHCGSAIFYKLNIAKHVSALSVSSFEGSFLVTGMPSFPSYVPGPFSPYSDTMSFLERVVNALMFCAMKVMGPVMTEPWNAMLVERFGQDFPTAVVIDIGGISVSSQHQPLNENWSSIMDLRKKTVLLSFGTVALSHLMPDQYKKTIRQTFRKFPDVTFIWKYEKPEHKISEGIDNIVEATWIPQNDMLYDPRLSLFISHCGQGSTNEAAMAGVPLIVIPVLGDQIRNAQEAENFEGIKRAGTGVVLEKQDLGATDKLEAAIREVLSNDEYSTKARKLAEMINNKPFTARKTFVKNMEFVAKYGPLRMLDHYGLHLNFFQYYLIDVFAFIGLVLVVVIIIAVIALKSTFKCLMRRCRKQKID